MQQPQRRTVTASPENSETPLEHVSSWVTPNRLFFVRNHFDVPAADTATWTLTLDGLVARPLRWTFAELAAMPQHSVFATVECAGNGRSFLSEKAAGVQWGAGAIGHAEWSGVRLRDLLQPAGLKPSALEIVFEGADVGHEHDHPAPLHFSRSLPVSKAMHPDTLIALRMNGEWLEPNHGAPMRLFVPGWYGVASVKWLRSMRAIDRVYNGYFQTEKYAINRATGNGHRRLPLGPGIVKSEILSPAGGAALGLGTHRVTGIAWAGEDQISRVDLSSDGGRTWHAVSLKGPQQPYSWCQWETLWTVSAPGSYTLMARAHSASGQTQPLQYNPDNLGYLINIVLARTVQVHSGEQRGSDIQGLRSWADTMQAYAEENTRRPLDLDLMVTGGDGI